MFKSNVKPA